MKIEIPTNCPACGSTLELVNNQLFCRNRACTAQLAKKLEHFAKVLGIKGLGPKTLEKLDLQDIPEIFYLDKADLEAALGSEKVAVKLLEEISTAKNASLADVLAGFSIPLIGAAAGAKLATVINSLDEITEEACKLAGLGDKATENLILWYNTDYREMKEFLPFSFSSSKPIISNAKGQTVCITGKLKSFHTKKEAKEALEAAGYTVVDSVTKTLNILIDEANDNSTKRQKAEQYGIKIVEDLTSLLN